MAQSHISAVPNRYVYKYIHTYLRNILFISHKWKMNGNIIGIEERMLTAKGRSLSYLQSLLHLQLMFRMATPSVVGKSGGD